MTTYKIYPSSPKNGDKLIAARKFNLELSRVQLFKLRERESKKYGANVIIIKQ